MFRKVLLTREEKQVIKKISRIQIKNLQRVIEDNGYTDLELFLLQHDDPITKEEVKEFLLEDLNLYKALKKDPQIIFSFDEDDLCIAKHILNNFCGNDKYATGKARVWKKLFYMEYLPISLQ